MILVCLNLFQHTDIDAPNSLILTMVDNKAFHSDWIIHVQIDTISME